MKRQTENLILALPMDNPLCSISVIDTDGNGVFLEQSLELGWKGNTDRCRELYAYLLRQDIRMGFKFKKADDGYTSETVDGNITFKMFVRGRPDQLLALSQMLKIRGTEYFDLTLKARREYRDAA